MLRLSLDNPESELDSALLAGLLPLASRPPLDSEPRRLLYLLGLFVRRPRKIRDTFLDLAAFLSLSESSELSLLSLRSAAVSER